MGPTHAAGMKVGCALEVGCSLDGIAHARYDPDSDANRPLGQDELRIVSMNVRGMKDEWNERKQALLLMLQRVEPDVWHLQESTGSQRDWFEHALSKSGRKSERYIHPDVQTVVNTSALSRRNFRVEDFTFHHFFPNYALGVPIRGFLCQLLVQGDTRIVVVNTHLDFRANAPGQRLSETLKILQFLGSPDSGFDWHAAVLTGDFNGEPHEEFYQELERAGFTSTMKSYFQREYPTYKMGDVTTRRTRHSDDSGGKIFGQALDYIWYRGSLELELVGQIGTEAIMGHEGLFPSDHAGLVARFRIGTTEHPWCFNLKLQQEEVYANKSWNGNVADRNSHTNYSPDRRNLIQKLVGDGKYVIQLADGKQMHVVDGWVKFAQEGAETNCAAHCREWTYVPRAGDTFTLQLGDLQLYSDWNGHLCVARPGECTNTEDARRLFTKRDIFR